jgi:hypothetical protein
MIKALLLVVWIAALAFMVARGVLYVSVTLNDRLTVLASVSK